MLHTEKIFEKDSYLKQTESKIIYTKGNIAYFKRTIFYAQSGGQLGDIGELESESGEKIRVINTTYDAQRNVCHYLEKPIGEVKGVFQLKIDWERRYQLMKMHSCMHVICSLIDADITGCAVGVEKSRMDFDLKDNTLDKEQLTTHLKQLIIQGAEVSYEWWDKTILVDKPELLRTTKGLPFSFGGKYRIIKIEGVDTQPCGGTHVSNIKEIGKIAITKIKKKGGSNRRIYIEFV